MDLNLIRIKAKNKTRRPRWEARMSDWSFWTGGQTGRQILSSGKEKNSLIIDQLIL